MIKTIYDPERLVGAIKPLCRPVPNNGVIFRRSVNMVVDRRMADMLRRFYGLVNVDMNLLRTHFIRMWTYVLDGAIPPRVPPVIDDLVRVNPIVNPIE